MAYPYKPLQETHIRLLEIHSGALDAPILCSLFHIEIGPSVNYEALSYTWGSPEQAHGIICDGVSFNVTENLYAALRRIRHLETTRTIWIDQICIDQSNILERNSQVAFMGTIYANASQVLIWLGEEDSESDMAFSFLSELARRGSVQNKASNTLGTLLQAGGLMLVHSPGWFALITCSRDLGLEEFG